MSKKFYVITTIILAAAVLALAGVATWAYTDGQGYRSQLENGSRKAFYDLVADVNNLEVKLNKVNVSSSASYQRQQLLDIWRQSDLAATNLSSLSTGNSLVGETTKFVNQTSDYCKYLSDRIAETGEPLSSAEKAALRSLYETNVSLKDSLNSYDVNTAVSEMSFSGYDSEGSNNFVSSLNENVDSSIDYPELIYDGPFSDSIQNKTPKLSGEEVGVDAAIEYFAALHGIDKANVADNGESSGRFKVFNLSYGDTVAQVTAIDCKLLSMNNYHECDQQEYNEEQCITIAERFVKSAGFDNMKKVWISNYNGIMYINFVYASGETVCYSDMVKVKVASDTGAIVGFEAQEYLTNHYDRGTVPAPTLSENEVLDSIIDNMTLSAVTLALVPDGESETLTYELYGQYEGTDFFIYVDAKTGYEIEVLQVIDGDQGRLLI